jgi:hypothetical protein
MKQMTRKYRKDAGKCTVVTAKWVYKTDKNGQTKKTQPTAMMLCKEIGNVSIKHEQKSNPTLNATIVAARPIC